MATIDINAILNNLPRSTKENPNLINPNVNMNMTPNVQPGVVFSKPRVAQSNQPNFFQSPIPGSRPNMRPSILDTTNNKSNMNQAFTEAGLLDQNVPVANQPGTPPNKTNNLLNFVGSPQGQAFFAGIDTRASNVPMSIIERLQPGYQAYLKSKSDQTKLANEKAQLNKQYELDLYNAYTDRISALSKDNRTTLEKDMATLYPNLQPGSSDYQAQALKYLSQKTPSTEFNFPNKKDEMDYSRVIEQKNLIDESLVTNREMMPRLKFLDMQLSDENFQTGALQQAFLPILNKMASLGLLSEEEMATVANLQSFQAMANYLVPRMRPAGSGSTSDFEANLFLSATASLGKDTQSNRLIIKGMMAMSDYYNRKGVLLKSLMNKNNNADYDKETYDQAIKDGMSKLDAMVYAEIGNVADRKLGDMFKQYGTDEEIDKAYNNGNIKLGDLFYDKSQNQFFIFSQENIPNGSN
jgi:hypothetical protein